METTIKILSRGQVASIVRIAVAADNQRRNYIVYLKQLEELKKIHRRLDHSNKEIESKKEIIQIDLEKLRKIISTRFSYLLKLYPYDEIYRVGEPRIFCEAYSVGNGKYKINSNTVTKNPISQLGIKDIERGYVNLTQVKLLPSSKIILTPLKIDLITGIISITDDNEIEDSY